MSFDLFPDPVPSDARGPVPLAERLRPQSLDGVAGQEHLTGPGKLLRRALEGGVAPSLILWGPPGSGKTTLARILAGNLGARFAGLSAVSAGIKEIREVVEAARRSRKSGQRTVLFLDEIHRFNKAQQDALLPHVESGLLILLGATTENPSFEVNAALLSRCQVVVLHPLGTPALESVLERALGDSERGLGARPLRFEEGARDSLLHGADGDARRLLNALEIAADLAARDTPASDEAPFVSREHIREALQERTLLYDREGEEHFNQISALHKCVRATDPQGAVYWTVRMLAAGEAPLYIARRLVRMAVEDIGLADPAALSQAVAAKDAVHFLGLPEGGAALVQVAIYLALAPKSNRVDVAEKRAREAIANTGALPVPERFRNPVTPLLGRLGYGRGYQYDHDAPDAFAGQDGLPEPLAGSCFYEPSPRGYEADLSRRLRELEAGRRPPGAKSP